MCFVRDTLRWGRRVAVALPLVLLGGTTTGCEGECEVTDALYEPFKQAMSNPEGFDVWLAQHPNYFTAPVEACMQERVANAYQNELELLDDCDRILERTSDPQAYEICRNGIPNPELAQLFWQGVYDAAVSPTIEFIETPIGLALIEAQRDDRAHWASLANTLFLNLGPALKEGLTCKKCRSWYDIF